MRVVDVDRHFVREVVDRAEPAQMAAHHVLDGRGDEEILLTKPQALSLGMVVGGVEDLADDFRHCVFFHGAHVVALVEFFHVDAGGFRTPQTQHADAAAVLAGDVHVIRHGVDRFGADDVDAVVLVVPALGDLPLKGHGERFIVALLEPDFAARQPEVRQLRLPAVHEFLLENAVFIEDRIARGVIALRRQTVEIARGQATEAAVSEARIRFAFVESVELDAVILQSLGEYVCQIQIVQRVLERASHQELHAEINDLFLSCLVALAHEFLPAGIHQVAQDQRQRAVIMLVGRLLGRNAHEVGKLRLDLRFRLLLGHRVIHSVASV